ncbi:MAG: apolipoprotein N-acyltransferase [Epsilonproteobacteria bacterium]|nr:apolipoprotein N-acyltransferase [Campylobacterota bacterium]
MLKRLFINNQLLYSLIIGWITALLFTSFLFFSHYGIHSYFLNTITALIGFYLLLHVNKRAVLFAGFFIGILWFYWISYSFKYNGVGYIAPLVVFGFGIVYMLYFGVTALSDKPYIRALLLFGISFYAPVDFNWMQLSLPFVESYIGIYKWQLAIILFALSADGFIKNSKYRYLPLILLIFAFNFQGYPPKEKAPLKIKLVQTNVKQEEKWTQKALRPTLRMVFEHIENAIEEGYDVVVLPESVIPLYLNRQKKLLEQLLFLSNSIDIVLGSLEIEGDTHYNATYHFYNGQKIEILRKVVLVPFGEYIPLPSFLQKWVNETFFAGASDFKTAKRPQDLHIKGIKFRNAICYEATTDILYHDHPKYMIAISNNAWFAPSIEPTLQRLLMQYYSNLYGTTIYHSANYKGTGIIF